MSEFYKNYLDYFTHEQWAGLLFIHAFHVEEFPEVTLDQSLQLFIEMLWVHEYDCTGVDLTTAQPTTPQGTLELNTNRTNAVMTPSQETDDIAQEALTFGAQFVETILPDYYEKIVRGMEKHKRKAELIDFYSAGNAPDKREHIFLEDDLSEFYVVNHNRE